MTMTDASSMLTASRQLAEALRASEVAALKAVRR